MHQFSSFNGGHDLNMNSGIKTYTFAFIEQGGFAYRPTLSVRFLHTRTVHNYISLSLHSAACRSVSVDILILINKHQTWFEYESENYNGYVHLVCIDTAMHS
jgi:hypothetical protein